MKKFDLLVPMMALFVACLNFGCSESTKITGTAEEPNEFAVVLSSSSIAVSSESVVSSSSEFLPPDDGKNSSSSFEKVESSSSSLENSGAKSFAVESSSSVEPEVSSSSIASEVSSSSQEQISSSSVEESSSSALPPQGGTMSSSSVENPNSLKYYIDELGLNINQVYEGAMATKLTEETDSDTAPGQAAATEFDGPWPHRFVKQNIGALEYFFPNAADEYAGLIDSIKAGQAEDGCWLYMMNVYGNDKSVGYVLADVSENKVVVLDISAGECPNSAVNKTFRFLFRYCGVIATSPEIEHVEVDLNIPEGLCPDFGRESEWVK